MDMGNLNPFDPNTAAAIANLGNEMEGEAKEEGGVDQEEHVTGLAGAYDDLMSSAASHSSQPNNSTGSLHSKNDDEPEKQQQQEEERENFCQQRKTAFENSCCQLHRGCFARYSQDWWNRSILRVGP